MAEHKATLVRGRKDSNVGATPRVLSPVPHITIPTPRAQPPGPIELPAHAAHPPDGIAVAARPPGMAVGVGRAGDAAEFSRPHRRESDPLLRIPELSHGSQDAQDPSQFPHPPTAVSDSRSPSDAVPPRGDASTASVHFAGLPPKTARGAVPFVSSVFDFGPKSARLSSLGSLGSAVAPRSTAAARMETRALLKERYGSAAAVAAGKGLRHSASVDDPASNPVAAFEKMVFDVRMKQWKQRALLDRDENFDMDLARLNERNNDMNVDAEFVQKALADEKKGTWDIRNIEFDNHSDSEFEAEVRTRALHCTALHCSALHFICQRAIDMLRASLCVMIIDTLTGRTLVDVDVCGCVVLCVALNACLLCCLFLFLLLPLLLWTLYRGDNSRYASCTRAATKSTSCWSLLKDRRRCQRLRRWKRSCTPGSRPSRTRPLSPPCPTRERLPPPLRL